MGHLKSACRRIFPRSGRAYELFDTAILLFVLGLFGYVLTSPPNTEALAPLQLVTATEVGVAVAGAAFFAIVCSYTRRFLNLGFTVAIFGSSLMCANFLIGSIILSWGTDSGVRALMAAILYGWITRRFFRNASLPVDPEGKVAVLPQGIAVVLPIPDDLAEESDERLSR